MKEAIPRKFRSVAVAQGKNAEVTQSKMFEDRRVSTAATALLQSKMHEDQRSLAPPVQLREGQGISSAPTEVFQMKVGLEFQTVKNSQFQKRDRTSGSDLAPSNSPGIEYMDQLQKEHTGQKWKRARRHYEDPAYVGAGWVMMGDMGDLEFITKAVPETATGRGELVNAVSNIAATVGSWQKRTDKEGYFRPKAFKKTDYRTQLADGVTAHPQSTIGLTLEALPEFLLKSIPSTKEVMEPSLEDPFPAGQFGWGNNKREAKQRESLVHFRSTLQMLSDSTLPPKVKGIAMLAISQIATAIGADAREAEKPKTASLALLKDYAPFMHRTSYSEMVKELEPAERKALAGIASAKLGAEFDKDLFSYWGDDEFEGAYRKGATTGRQFLKTVFIDGKDPFVEWFSESQQSIAELHPDDSDWEKSKLRFGLTKATDIGSGMDDPSVPTRVGVIMELRAMQRNVPIAKWPAIAGLVHDAVSAANKPKEKTPAWLDSTTVAADKTPVLKPTKVGGD